jgi:hypothetical protein
MKPKKQYTEVIQTRLLMFGLEAEIGFAPADLEIDLQRKWAGKSMQAVKDIKKHFGISLPKGSHVHTEEGSMGQYSMGTDKWNPIGVHQNTKPHLASRGYIEEGTKYYPWMSILMHQINDIYARIYNKDTSSMTCVTFYPVKNKKDDSLLSFVAIISDGNYKHNIAIHVTSQGRESLLWRGGLDETPELHALRVWSVEQYMPARWDEDYEEIVMEEPERLSNIESNEERSKYVKDHLWQTIYLPAEH